jgi:tetratricopeptide (TPR) repeat protein
MTIRIADHAKVKKGAGKGGKRGAAAPAAADPLRGARVYCAGPLACMDHEAFEQLLISRGASVAASMDDCTLAIVGEGHWPPALAGSPGSRLQVLEELDQRVNSAGLVVLSEKQFASAMGLDQQCPEPTEEQQQLFSTARLTELLGVARERIRAWVKAGLIVPTKTEHGVWHFDFRQVSAARTLCDLTAAGVSTERIRRSLALLRKFMPNLEQPLEQLAALDKDGRLLVRLAGGDLSESDGQLHFEFTGGDPALPASPMRIAAGPRTAADWLAQGLEQEQEGFLEEAAASYRQALMVGGPDAQTCLNLANTLRALGSKPQALERYSQAAEIDPEFSDAWNNLGTLLVELGRADDACVAFGRALAADADDARAHYNLADTLDDLGREAEAVPHWQAYLRIDPLSKWGQYARTRLGS